MEIIQTPEETTSETSHPSELEMPQLPHRPSNTDYGTNIRKIHQTALNIIRLQEQAKEQKQIDDTEYRENLDSLNIAAENLAKIQDRDEDDLFGLNTGVGLSPWFERKKSNKKDKDKRKEEERRKKEEEERKRKDEEEEKKRKEEEEETKRKEEEEKKKKEEEEKRKKEQEKEKEEEEEEEEEDRDNESVAVNLPPEDASVAEAKPVGLAIAGVH